MKHQSPRAATAALVLALTLGACASSGPATTSKVNATTTVAGPAKSAPVDIEPEDVQLATPEDGRLNGLAVSFEVAGSGVVNAEDVGLSPERGTEAFAVDVSLAGDPVHIKRAAIVADGKDIVSWSPSSPGGETAVAFVVAKGAPVELQLEEWRGRKADPTSTPVSQSYDLRKHRVLDPIEVLYRNRDGDPVPNESVPCKWTEVGARENPDTPCTVALDVSSVRLEYVYSRGGGSDAGYLVPSERDKALLVVDSPQALMYLVDDHGKRIDAIEPTPPDPATYNGDRILDPTHETFVFEVPADAVDFEIVTNAFDNGMGTRTVAKRGLDHRTNLSVPL